MTDTELAAPAVWYDGVTALRHEGTARWAPPGVLLLEQNGTTALDIGLDDLR